MVRLATEADIPQIVEWGREAHGGSTYAGLVEFVPEDFEAACRHLMSDDDAVVLVSGRGSLWMKRFPVYFNHAETFAHEVFFYATKGGDALRRAGQRWASGDLVTFSRNDATDPRLDALYRRAGLRPLEHTFIGRA